MIDSEKEKQLFVSPTTNTVLFASAIHGTPVFSLPRRLVLLAAPVRRLLRAVAGHQQGEAGEVHVGRLRLQREDEERFAVDLCEQRAAHLRQDGALRRLARLQEHLQAQRRRAAIHSRHHRRLADAARVEDRRPRRARQDRHGALAPALPRRPQFPRFHFLTRRGGGEDPPVACRRAESPLRVHLGADHPETPYPSPGIPE